MGDPECVRLALFSVAGVKLTGSSACQLLVSEIAEMTSQIIELSIHPRGCGNPGSAKHRCTRLL